MTPLITDEIGRAAQYLDAAGIDGAQREATTIWATVTGITPADVWSRLRDPVPGHPAAFWAAVTRRARGMPLAYALGLAAFRHLELAVDPRVLIPRPETEGLVQRVLDWTAAHRPRGMVLEIGTGSGCIALSLATEGVFASIVATESSAGALEVAKRNLARLAPPVPVDFRHGRFFRPVRDERFDVVVSNPPYVRKREFKRLDASVKDFEPKSALVSRRKGMAHIRKIARGALSHLTPGGLLALEIDARRRDDALREATRAQFPDARIEQDVFGRPRYLLATRPG